MAILLSMPRIMTDVYCNAWLSNVPVIRALPQTCLLQEAFPSAQLGRSSLDSHSITYRLEVVPVYLEPQGELGVLPPHGASLHKLSSPEVCSQGSRGHSILEAVSGGSL